MIDSIAMTTPKQIPIPFAIDEQMSREAFFPSSSNAAIVTLLDEWPHWPSPIMLFSGPNGCGKTHAAKAWAEIADAQVWSADMLGQWTPEIAISHNIVIDDIDRQLTAESEIRLFHLINALRGSHGTLVLTAQSIWPEWGIKLPDLASRLKTAVQVQLNAPDDILLSAVITKLFADRQIEVAPHVVGYLITHMDRSLADARYIVEEMDKEAMRLKSKITRNIAANILAQNAIK